MERIVRDWPPNIAAIRAKLPVTRSNIFAYDHIIYSPGFSTLPLQLHAHEAVHFVQQDAHGGGVEGWWDDYLRSAKFRLAQEIPAHREEYRCLLASAPSRQVRRKVKAKDLNNLAKRLSSPMYGGIITMAQAKMEISA